MQVTLYFDLLWFVRIQVLSANNKKKNLKHLYMRFEVYEPHLGSASIVRFKYCQPTENCLFFFLKER